MCPGAAQPFTSNYVRNRPESISTSQKQIRIEWRTRQSHNHQALGKMWLLLLLLLLVLLVHLLVFA